MVAFSLRSHQVLAGLTLTGLTLASATACKGGGEDDDYGSARIFLKAGGNCDDCFKGTKTIRVQTAYNGCIASFYSRVPAAQFTDTTGKAVVDEWMERLCAEKDPSDPPSAGQVVPCKVKEKTMVQSQGGEMGTTFIGMKFQLTVSSDKLVGREIRIGPIPTKGVANCPEGQTPLFNLSSQSVLGMDENDDPIWNIESFTNSELGAGYNTKMDATIKNYDK